MKSYLLFGLVKFNSGGVILRNLFVVSRRSFLLCRSSFSNFPKEEYEIPSSFTPSLDCDSKSRNNTTLNNQIRTTFGYLRLDSENSPDYHGQEDDSDISDETAQCHNSDISDETAQCHNNINKDAPSLVYVKRDSVETKPEHKSVLFENDIDSNFVGNVIKQPVHPSSKSSERHHSFVSRDSVVYAKSFSMKDNQNIRHRKEVDTPKSSSSQGQVPNVKNVIADNSALAFVKKMRKKLNQADSKNKSIAEIFKTEQQELIGVSLQSRLEKTASDNSAGLTRLSSSCQEEDVPSPKTAVSLKYKFRPQNFDQMTSLEVIEILHSSIVYDRHDIVCLSKPYGIGMYENESVHSIERYLSRLASRIKSEQLFTVHRLDKTTTGLILLTRTKKMQIKLANLFRKRKIEKYYWTIVNGTPLPSQGDIRIDMREAKIDNRYRMTIAPDYASLGGLISNKNLTSAQHHNSILLPAVTKYRTIESFGNSALLEVNPQTGYKHQVRCHLGLGLSCPILGDHKYSYIDSLGKPQKIHGDILNRIGVSRSRSRDMPLFLHAKTLNIPDVLDENRYLVIRANLPHFFTQTMRRLRLTPSSNQTINLLE